MENLCNNYKNYNLHSTDLAFVGVTSGADFTFGDEKKDLNKDNSRFTEVHSQIIYQAILTSSDKPSGLFYIVYVCGL